MSISCVLLAAGSGTRFGGDKLLYAPEGKESMLHSALRLHAGLPYKRRILVARPGDDPVIRCAEEACFEVVLNPRHKEGIGTSAAAAAKALLAGESIPEGVLFGVCDQPYLREETLRALMEAFDGDPARIVAPVFGEKRGNPVIFPSVLLPEFLTLSQDVGGSAIIKAHRELLKTIPAAQEQELRDIDTKPTVMSYPF